MVGTVVKAMNTNKLIEIKGISSITKKSGAIHARALSKPAQIKPSAIQLVNMDAVKKVLSISNAGVQVSQIKVPHKIETIINGRRLSHSILGCIVPTKAKPKDLKTCCMPSIDFHYYRVNY
jgi:hypothetical protein